ncbi:UNVERIFIED_CONTAM: hypothetical protein HDU68_002192 [Siphonaria sp. JEL0065]|nr:hypothetical protein HDU68_002192 [Siphonaria sp. JEL0065]
MEALVKADFVCSFSGGLNGAAEPPAAFQAFCGATFGLNLDIKLSAQTACAAYADLYTDATNYDSANNNGGNYAECNQSVMDALVAYQYYCALPNSGNQFNLPKTNYPLPVVQPPPPPPPTTQRYEPWPTAVRPIVPPPHIVADLPRSTMVSMPLSKDGNTHVSKFTPKTVQKHKKGGAFKKKAVKKFVVSVHSQSLVRKKN